MKIVERIKRICKYVQVACIGNRIRKRIFLEMLLVKANHHWFGFSDQVMKMMCKEMALAIPGDCMRVSNVSLDHFDQFQRHAAYCEKNLKGCNPLFIDILRITPTGYQSYLVELLNVNLNYDRDNSESQKYVIRMNYEVTIPYEEIEKEMMRI